MKIKIIGHLSILTTTAFFTIVLSHFVLSSNIENAFAQNNPPPSKKIDLKKIPKEYKKAYELISELADGPGKKSEEDEFCSSKLFGTASLESCEAGCPVNGCTLVQAHKKEFNPELEEDLDCYACGAGMSCYDMGLIYKVPDCAWCEINPKKQCVAGIPVPGLGFGPGSIPFPRDPAGVQCYDCIDRKDKCKDIWPGTTWDAACGGVCKKDEKCVQRGVHPDGYGCFQCQKIPPPPIDCNDAFWLHQNQCHLCPPDTDCVATGVKDEKGNMCFNCVPKNQPPPPPPEPPKETCEDFGWKTPACSCDPNKEIEINQMLGDELSCCKCEPNPCQPSPPRFTLEQCQDQCPAPDKCWPQTTVRGETPCYTCSKYKKPAETCEEAGLPSSCNPFPCDSGELCAEQVIPLVSGKEVNCAICSPNDNVDPSQCGEYQGVENCAVCYQAGMTCEMFKATDNPELWCAKCFDQCDEQGAVPGDCSLPGTCPDDHDCITTDDGCHICQPKPKCEDGLLEGSCPAQCGEGLECAPAGNDCHACVNKAKEVCTERFPGTMTLAECEDDCHSPMECHGVAGYGDGEGHTYICYKCEEPYQECKELGLLSIDDCDPCNDDPETSCFKAGKTKDGEQCYECKTMEKQVCDERFPGTVPLAECEANCESPMECHGVAGYGDGEGNQYICYKCEEPYQECKELGLLSIDDCDPCNDDPETSCFKAGKTKDGEQCYECKTMEKQVCDERFPGTVPLAECEANCESPMECHGVAGYGDGEGNQYICYKCEEPYQECSELEMLSFDDCEASCLKDPGSYCSATVKTKDGEQCYECKKRTQTGLQCSDGATFGICPANCSQGQNCVQVDDNCYRCEEKPKTTPPPPPPPKEECPKGTQPGACTPSSCSSDQECVAAGHDENCHRCQKKKQSCEDMGLSDGETCSQSCPSPNKCVQGKQDDYGTWCWECKTKDNCSLGYEPKPCFGAGVICGFDYVCEQDDNWCHKCVPIDRPPPIFCDQGFAPGICPGNCSGDQECVQAGECYQCKDKPKVAIQCDEDYKPGSCKDQFECFEPACYEIAGPCYKCRPGDCHEPFFREKDCKYCKEKGGQCMPAGAHIASGIAGIAENYHSLDDCYKCEMPEKPQTIVEVTYIIIIVETPLGRYILKDAKDKSSFEPGSVAALARAESLGGNLFKAGAAVFNGAQAVGSIESLSNLLAQSTAKKKSFSDDCFSGVQPASLEKQPPALANEKNPSKDFGSDPSDEVVVNGPIVSCGKVDGKDALVVFDFSGVPVKTILKEELKKNPNALLNALNEAEQLSQKAQHISQQISQLQNLNAKTAAQYLTQMVKKSVEGDAEENVIPDDPLFHFSEKKKKKLFGVLGSSKPVASALGGGNDLFSTARESAGEEDVKDQWGLKKIGYKPMSDPSSAWHVIDGSKKNVLVAVIDSGIDLSHEDVPEFIWVNDKEIAGNGKDDDQNGYVDDVHGWNFLNDNNDLTDFNGHGTFTSGIIAAKRNNGLGIAGINPGAVIMPLKVANEDGETDSLLIYRAIHYAVRHGARVLNISLGARGISALEQAAINFAASNGVFVAVASGNTGEYMGDVGPASADHAFTVGAIDMDGFRSTISSEGPNNALLAPGESIYSLRSKDSFHKRAIKDELNKLYFTQSGTSFSTPIVAATASLMLVLNPDLKPRAIENILMATAVDMDEAGWDGKTGAGLLDAFAALKNVSEEFFNVKIVRFAVNKNEKGKLESVDVYATVGGAGFKEFVLGVGKGKLAKKFKTVAGPFSKVASSDWVARIGADSLRGSDEWVVQIEGKDTAGNVKTAQALLELK